MRFTDELRAANDAVWSAQHAHPFVRGIADGTLDRARFEHYIRQDHCFLVDYGRLLALGAARAPDLATMARFADLTQGILVTEMGLHRAFASRWGIAAEALADERPAPRTRAYTDHLLRTAALGDLPELAAVLLPCMWGYAEIGSRLAAEGAATDANPYAEWVAMYAGEEFGALAVWCRGLVDDLAQDAGPRARRRMAEAFATSSALELGFWDMAWELEAVRSPVGAAG